jgi:hypothetical protein
VERKVGLELSESFLSMVANFSQTIADHVKLSAIHSRMAQKKISQALELAVASRVDLEESQLFLAFEIATTLLWCHRFQAFVSSGDLWRDENIEVETVAKLAHFS